VDVTLLTDTARMSR